MCVFGKQQSTNVKPRASPMVVYLFAESLLSSVPHGVVLGPVGIIDVGTTTEG